MVSKLVAKSQYFTDNVGFIFALVDFTINLLNKGFFIELVWVQVLVILGLHRHRSG